MGVGNIIRVSVNKQSVVNISVSSGIVEKVIYIEDDISSTKPYDGDYVFTSSFDDQVLNTSGKYLKENIHINKMPINRMSNPDGGITLVIG